jgi:hypothetical protein
MEPRHLITNAAEYFKSIKGRNHNPYSQELVSRIIKIWEVVEDSNTIKFAIPDNGVLFDDEFRGIPNKIRLPFPTISIEFSGSIILANENATKDLIVITSFHKLKDSKTGWTKDPRTGNSYWWPNCFQSTLDLDSKMTERGFPFGTKVLFEEIYKRCDQKVMREIHESGVRAVLELIEALSCSNVYLETILPPEKLNKRRLLEGKCLVYEYKILTLSVPTEHSLNRVSLGGSHNSPRRHLRRGHIRIYNRSTLEEYKIWINSMIINRKHSNKIDKGYSIHV